MDRARGDVEIAGRAGDNDIAVSLYAARFANTAVDGSIDDYGRCRLDMVFANGVAANEHIAVIRADLTSFGGQVVDQHQAVASEDFRYGKFYIDGSIHWALVGWELFKYLRQSPCQYFILTQVSVNIYLWRGSLGFVYSSCLSI